MTSKTSDFNHQNLTEVDPAHLDWLDRLIQINNQRSEKIWSLSSIKKGGLFFEVAGILIFLVLFSLSVII